MVINKGIVLSALALFMTAQLVSTNIAVWLYAVIVETVEANNGTLAGTNDAIRCHKCDMSRTADA